ncbi:helix-turn-helix domain-containing protein [Hymenobacter jeollabukensis]|uniref:Helix-turn-helix transcriptional regulator n=1 Tax=Hymenobacter jeollabukensis TaxID=2025313 RepID=A0A5R8WJW8_9BACT|nr:AraC family transcriptional regulator [Hymenobacter jeollabukensis]TLM89230.1 helix-turn-helix transcriptional regulator [Hymenobacter jeollabukensis]
MNADLLYHSAPPEAALAGVVESFWQLKTGAEAAAKPIWLLPDGRIDVLFSYSATEPYHVMLMGLGSTAEPATLAAGTVLGGVSLHLPAAEYLLGGSVADILNGARPLPADFWGVTPADLADFGQFCARLSAALRARLRPIDDARKRRLFELLYASDGALPVHELADRAGWSSRQINRYFQQYFGLSLKAYCAILRFRAAFPQLKAGRLFPEQHFADQAHFIREVRRLAGVRPKDLVRNENDRFIQFSAWTEK